MIQRYTPLKRTPVKKKRSKPRPGRLKGSELENLRHDCYTRDRAICQKCGHMCFNRLPQEHDESYHMSHKVAKARGGDTLDNVETLCGKCHRKFHNFGPSMTKPVPPKVQNLE